MNGLPTAKIESGNFDFANKSQTMMAAYILRKAWELLAQKNNFLRERQFVCNFGRCLSAAVPLYTAVRRESNALVDRRLLDRRRGG